MFNHFNILSKDVKKTKIVIYDLGEFWVLEVASGKLEADNLPRNRELNLLSADHFD